jgi:hypothetical protein
MVAFDIATAIALFVADSERTCLELPHLTTGQRKGAKTLLQQHPELSCESYGFGSERRLHLFKIESKPEMCPPTKLWQNLPAGKLPVRNTFIQFEDIPVSDRAVQSMPHGMFRQHALAEACGKAAKEEAPLPCSDAEDEATEHLVFCTTPTSEPEAEPTAHGPKVAVQSTQRVQLRIGELVLVQGLTKAPAFNGLSGVVQCWDEALGRYGIVLVSADGACHQAKVKHENLQLLLPCP